MRAQESSWKISTKEDVQKMSEHFVFDRKRKNNSVENGSLNKTAEVKGFLILFPVNCFWLLMLLCHFSFAQPNRMSCFNKRIILLLSIDFFFALSLSHILNGQEVFRAENVGSLQIKAQIHK